MYATEKYVRMEDKELQQKIHELDNDIGGDIRYLHQELTELRNQVQQLTENITELREHLNV